MIAIDTNIIVRFLTQDDELQFQKSREILQPTFRTPQCHNR
ncbi:hypothetical protein [Sphaerospermopsis sp. FACHB-1094]|nr:hypothetical protein [Sphaerospermopsis sp. FACHB-1094]